MNSPEHKPQPSKDPLWSSERDRSLLFQLLASGTPEERPILNSVQDIDAKNNLNQLKSMASSPILSNLISVISLFTTIILTLLIFRWTSQQDIGHVAIESFQHVVNETNNKSDVYVIIRNDGNTTVSDARLFVKIPQVHNIRLVRLNLERGSVSSTATAIGSGSDCEILSTREGMIKTEFSYTEFVFNIDSMYVGDEYILEAEFMVDQSVIKSVNSYTTESGSLFPWVQIMEEPEGYIRTYFINDVDIKGNKTNISKSQSWSVPLFPREISMSQEDFNQCRKL